MTYFVTSDIHGFYTVFKKALKKAKFDITNKDHVLIICGDLFDRGEESKKLYNYLTKFPQDRLVLIRGNHEQLLLDLLEKELPEKHDFSNRTVDTIEQFVDNNLCILENTIKSIVYFNQNTLQKQFWFWTDPLMEPIWESYKKTYEKNVEKAKSNWAKMVKSFKKKPIYKWLTSDIWKNYYEVGDYIFTHSFIPNNINWRNLDTFDDAWKNAMWENPLSLYKKGLFNRELENNKILVCGHWANFQHRDSDPNNLELSSHDIYKYENFIGLDAATAFSNKINIFKIEK